VTLVGVCGAELESWRERPERAAEYAEQAIRRLHEAYPLHLAVVSLAALGIAAYADVAARARRVKDDGAERTAIAAGEELLARAAETMANARPSSGAIGPEGRAWLRRAEAEATRLHGPGDPAVWRAVVDAFGYGETYREAHARWRVAEALLAGGDRSDREEAAEQLRLAVQVADELRAAPLREAVLRLARRARVGLDRGAAGATTNPLTPREQAVLSLVAAGRTNRQIGAELFISEKTVSVHLSRVMAKLEVASRTEAVSAAYNRGLLAPPLA
jgi:DNA-binding CsgD family transcriptional regulator